MTLTGAAGLSYYFGTRCILNNTSFTVDEKDRVGLVGVNGCGKTTLFKILTGEYSPESGELIGGRNTSIGYMEQFTISGGRSVYDEALTVFEPLMLIDDEIIEITASLSSDGSGDSALIERLHYLTEEFERRGGLTYKSKTRAALLGLGFSEEQLSRDAGELSGGQRSKIQLCKLLLSEANLLLLDEPTNHLDISSVEWLESYLLAFNGAYIIVSHDRYFLDKVTNRTLELENCRITSYNASYSGYLKQKATDREILIRHNENTEREIKRIEGIIEQQKRWNQERNYVTIASKQKQIDRIKEQLVDIDRLPDELHFKFPVRQGGANNVLICDRLTMSYGSTPVFSEVNLHVEKGERVFLLGPNGCGKTTLFKILCGKLAGRAGMYTVGSNIDVGYFDQTQESLHNEKTVLNEIWDKYPRMTETEVRTALAVFLFKGDDVFKNVGTLSGGERARLSILKLMLSQANFLLLDEPTNHLDITSREALERALRDYEGTLFIVSHDRYFINSLADRLYYMENGSVTEYIGNYDYFISRKKESTPVVVKKTQSQGAIDYKARKEQASAERKRKTRIERTENELEELTAEIESKTALLSDPSTSADYVKVLELTKELDELREREELLYETLDELYSLDED